MTDRVTSSYEAANGAAARPDRPMAVLTAYSVKKALAELELEAAQSSADQLVQLLDQNHRALVAALHQRIWPLVTTNSANNALQRLLKKINEAAEKAGMPLRARVTENRRAGPRQRWVWFEGPAETIPVPQAADLAAIKPGHLVEAPPGRLLDQPIVLLTCNEHEVAAVRAKFAPGAVLQTRHGISHYDLGRLGGAKVLQVVSGQGEEEAQAAAEAAWRVFEPRALIAVGIAFGMSEASQTIGDVLVGTEAWGYELKRANANGSLTPRGPHRDATPRLVNLCRAVDMDHMGDPAKALGWPKLQFGPLLSGSTLVDNLDYRDSLRRLYPEAIGGEMEAAGLARAARDHEVKWLVVKAICDWGDGNKSSPSKTRDQKTAAANAALVAHEVIRLGGWEAAERDLGFDPDRTTADGGHHGRRDSTPRPRTPDLDALDLMIDDPRGEWASQDKETAPRRYLWAGETEPRLTKPIGAGTPPVGPSSAGMPKSPPPRGRGVNVHQTLLDWARNVGASRCFALLGEYGMGKTIACQRLAKEIGERRATDPSWPIPLYFDFKHITGLKERVPSVDEAMAECAEAGWVHGGDLTLCSTEQIRAWISTGALVIFDGLDEVLVKLNQKDGAEFTRRLLSLAPPPESPNNPGTKVLISSRTQYFRTLRDERNHFTGEGRGDKGAESFQSLLLLPFTDQQVVAYLQAALPGSDAQRLLQTLESVHNLSDLAHRPFTLRLISKQIPAIEQARADGRDFYGSTLYRLMVDEWFDRDSRKHTIDRREDKLALASALAAHLWKNGHRAADGGKAGGAELPALNLEDWLHEWLAAEPRLARRYRNLDPDLLEEDLRNTTFLRRVDLAANKSVFRFAHTSLQEFFLAEYLIAGLREGRPERWTMACPSQETLDFLGQSLAEAEDQAELLAALTAMARQPDVEANLLILRYSMRARKQGLPTASLRGLRLPQANLRGLRLDVGALDLAEADFSGADLTDARLVQCGLEGADFGGAALRRAKLLDCSLERADFSGADLVGTVVRR
ncbi:MAG: pentapeptide repeat-containing protein, partial [Bifidobacteriaceae bacterium]|nr:pentapeptide repeat-containing protein [Bifidobacteriaceae bacterium]